MKTVCVIDMTTFKSEEVSTTSTGEANSSFTSNNQNYLSKGAANSNGQNIGLIRDSSQKKNRAMLDYNDMESIVKVVSKAQSVDIRAECCNSNQTILILCSHANIMKANRN